MYQSTCRLYQDRAKHSLGRFPPISWINIPGNALIEFAARGSGKCNGILFQTAKHPSNVTEMRHILARRSLVMGRKSFTLFILKIYLIPLNFSVRERWKVCLRIKRDLGRKAHFNGMLKA